jgi:drug/metabolite transporter (DMT)-like permease
MTLLVPIFGLLGSALFYQETIGSMKVLASVLVIAGLLVGLVKPDQLACFKNGDGWIGKFRFQSR